MTEVSRIWNDLPDAWALLDRESRRAVEGLWEGLDRVIRQMLTDLSRTGIDPLGEYALGEHLVQWQHFDGSVSPLTFEKTILAIPQLQDQINSPTQTWVEGTDYNIQIGDRTLTWVLPPPGGTLWAPRVLEANDHAFELFASRVAGLAPSGWEWNGDTRLTLPVLRCLWYAFLHGPTMDNLSAAMTAMMAMPQARHAGQVIDTGTRDTITVQHSDTFLGTADIQGTVVAGDIINAEATGTLISDRRLMFNISDPTNWRVGDWVIPDLDTGLAARRIVAKHPPDPEDGTLGSTQTILSSGDGITSAVGDWVGLSSTGEFAGGGSASWALVEPDDILEVRLPRIIAGRYRIGQVALVGGDGRPAGCFIQDLLLGGLSNLQFSVVRSPWIELDQALDYDDDEPLSFQVVRPTMEWPANIWTGYDLVDSHQGRYPILSNNKSDLRLYHTIAAGSCHIVPPHDDHTTEAIPVGTPIGAADRPAAVSLVLGTTPDPDLFFTRGGGQAVLINGSEVLDFTYRAYTTSTNTLAVAAGALSGTIDITTAATVTPLNDREDYPVVEGASSIVSPGDYVRRFETLLDTTRVTDWQSDERGRVAGRRPLTLAADADGSDTVRVDTTDGVAVNDYFTVLASGPPALDARVVAVQPATHQGQVGVVFAGKLTSLFIWEDQVLFTTGNPSSPAVGETLHTGTATAVIASVEGTQQLTTATDLVASPNQAVVASAHAITSSALRLFLEGSHSGGADPSGFLAGGGQVLVHDATNGLQRFAYTGIEDEATHFALLLHEDTPDTAVASGATVVALDEDDRGLLWSTYLAGRLQLNQEVDAGYTQAAMARLSPTRPEPEGPAGYRVIRPGRTAATIVRGQVSLIDPGGEFTSQDRPIKPADSVRVVFVDGTIFHSTISTIGSDTQLALDHPATRTATGAYYEVVQYYDADLFDRLTVDLVPYDEKLYDRPATIAVVEALKPLWIDYRLGDSALASYQTTSSRYDVGAILSHSLEVEFSLVPQRDEPIGADQGVADGSMIAGPEPYQWVLNEVLFATLTFDAVRNGARVFTRSAGDEGIADDTSKANTAVVATQIDAADRAAATSLVLGTTPDPDAFFTAGGGDAVLVNGSETLEFAYTAFDGTDTLTVAARALSGATDITTTATVIPVRTAAVGTQIDTSDRAAATSLVLGAAPDPDAFFTAGGGDAVLVNGDELVDFAYSAYTAATNTLTVAAGALSGDTDITTMATVIPINDLITLDEVQFDAASGSIEVLFTDVDDAFPKWFDRTGRVMSVYLQSDTLFEELSMPSSSPSATGVGRVWTNVAADAFDGKTTVSMRIATSGGLARQVLSDGGF